MNLMTPLPQVALYLPRDAAEILGYQPINRQHAMLKVVRRVLTDWEQQGIVLDPVTRDVVLTSLVKEVLGVVIGTLNHLQNPGDTDPFFGESP